MILGVIAGSESFSAQRGGFLNAGTIKVAQSFMRNISAAPEALQFAWKNPLNGVSEISRPEQHPASQQNQNHGVWVTSRYQVPEESFILLNIMKKTGGALVYDNAWFVLSMRMGAALRRLRIQFTGNPLATFPFGIIEGNFDIVPVEHFDKIGIALPPLILDKTGYSAEEFFEEVIVEREARPPPEATTETITTDSGATVKINKAPSRRVLNLRPRPKK
jgi:hypothetical protein